MEDNKDTMDLNEIIQIIKEIIDKEKATIDEILNGEVYDYESNTTQEEN